MCKLVLKCACVCFFFNSICINDIMKMASVKRSLKTGRDICGYNINKNNFI